MLSFSSAVTRMERMSDGGRYFDDEARRRRFGGTEEIGIEVTLCLDRQSGGRFMEGAEEEVESAGVREDGSGG